MANNRRAGPLRYRCAFQRRAEVDDGWGGTTPGSGPFETQFTASVGLTPRTGGEEVTAARLQGRQPYVATVRYSSETAGITTAWQLVHDGRTFAITSPPADPDGKRQWMEFIVVEGVAS